MMWMARLLGFGDGADGVLTSGGSIGNLTAFLAMRQATQADGDPRPCAVLVSNQAHYSVLRATKIMGWGAVGAIAVPCDDRFKLRLDALPERLRHAESLGRRVVGVVGSACTTATGTYDPLDAIADFCAERGLWFHVDAAHGAPAALSDTYRPLLRGVGRADSVVFDAHKMMLMPALVTAVLFRNGDHSYRVFEERASYLLDKDAREEWYNVGHRTLECTKRMLSLKVYTGADVLRDALLRRLHHAPIRSGAAFRCNGSLRSRLRTGRRAGSEILSAFRHVPDGAGDLDALQARIRADIVHSGAFYIVQTRLPKGLFMRVTLINPLTDEGHLQTLLARVRELAAGGSGA